MQNVILESQLRNTANSEINSVIDFNNPVEVEIAARLVEAESYITEIQAAVNRMINHQNSLLHHHCSRDDIVESINEVNGLISQVLAIVTE